MHVSEWLSAHNPQHSESGLFWQVEFVRNAILNTCAKTAEEFTTMSERLFVVGTHIYDSLVWPIYQVNLLDSTRVTMMDDGVFWIISVEALHPLKTDFLGLFSPNEIINYEFCPGFPPESVFGSYETNKYTFSFSVRSGIYGGSKLYAFFFLYAYNELGKR